MQIFMAGALLVSFAGGNIVGRFDCSSSSSDFISLVFIATVLVGIFYGRFLTVNLPDSSQPKKCVQNEIQYRDLDFQYTAIQNLIDPLLNPAENSLKLLRHILSEYIAEDLSEKTRSCLLYCVEAFETKPDDMCIPQALLKSDALENLGVVDTDCTVQEWLLSQFTRARSSMSLEHSLIVRETTSGERRASDALMESGIQGCKSSLECCGNDSKNQSDVSSEVSKESIEMCYQCNKIGFDNGRALPPTYGVGVMFSIQANGVRLQVRSSECLPFQATNVEKDAIMKTLLGIEKWDWDIFALREASNGREMQVLGWHILREWDLDRKFGIEEDALREWLNFVESSYSSCEYHNATHAADVLQTVHFMLTTGKASDFFGDHEILALLIAAMVHDIGHDGFTNSFHKHRFTDRALLHNDQSIQENFHIWMVFNQMSERPEINIFKSFTASEFAEIRRMLILLVLSTDMSKHFGLLQEVRSMLELNGRDPQNWAESTSPLMCFLLHACDIAGQAKAKHLALIWATRVFAEFFHQGDVENRLGLPTSPLCDRSSTVISSAEIGFIKFIMQPTFDLVMQLLPNGGEACLRELEHNLEYWRMREDGNARLRAKPPSDGVRRRATVAVGEAGGTGRAGGFRNSPMASPRRNVLQVSSRFQRSSVV